MDGAKYRRQLELVQTGFQREVHEEEGRRWCDSIIGDGVAWRARGVRMGERVSGGWFCVGWGDEGGEMASGLVIEGRKNGEEVGAMVWFNVGREASSEW